MINLTQSRIMQNWDMDNADTPLVSVRCITYNHEPYIAQALDGFLMQKTNFPFEVIVHDDASTDRTAEIIREYEARFPKIIKPIYETENQYSKHDGSLGRIMEAACKGKYIALCEGDDYWIDENKLQMQADFLEGNPEYTLCFSNAKIWKNNDFVCDSFPCLLQDRDVKTEEIILNGGLFIPTATIIYRNEIKNTYPGFCSKCWVGDYPLQIYASICGKVWGMSNVMSVYRASVPGSWTQRTRNLPWLAKRKGVESELRMLNGINELTSFTYNFPILKRKISFLRKNVWKEIPLVLSGKWYNTFLFMAILIVKISRRVLKKIFPFRLTKVIED